MLLLCNLLTNYWACRFIFFIAYWSVVIWNSFIYSDFSRPWSKRLSYKTFEAARGRTWNLLLRRQTRCHCATTPLTMITLSNIRCGHQLTYIMDKTLWFRWGSNPGPSPCEGDVITTTLRNRQMKSKKRSKTINNFLILVGGSPGVKQPLLEPKSSHSFNGYILISLSWLRFLNAVKLLDSCICPLNLPGTG